MKHRGAGGLLGMLLGAACHSSVMPAPDAAVSPPPIIIEGCPGPDPAACSERPVRPPCPFRTFPRTVGPELTAARLMTALWKEVDPSVVAEVRSGGFTFSPFIDRLLADPRARAPFAEVTRAWLGVAERPPAQVPDALWARFLEELDRFTLRGLVEADRQSASVTRLLLTDDVIADGALAAHYGLPPGSAEWQARPAPVPRPGGLLRLGAVLASHFTGPERGSLISAALGQCADLPLPAQHTILGGVGTPPRRVIESMVSGRPECVSCHELLQSGFGLQSYDDVGRLRAVEIDGTPIDDSGALVGPLDRQSFTGGADLARILAARAGNDRCLLSLFYQRLTARLAVDPPLGGEGCAPLGDLLERMSFRQGLEWIAFYAAMDWSADRP